MCLFNQITKLKFKYYLIFTSLNVLAIKSDTSSASLALKLLIISNPPILYKKLIKKLPFLNTISRTIAIIYLIYPIIFLSSKFVRLNDL